MLYLIDGEMCSVPSISQLYDIAGQPFLWGDGESMPECQSSHSGCKIVTMANKDSAPVTRAFDSSAEVENSVECDWRKHVSPDGDLYYYNCVACESRWENPVELSMQFMNKNLMA
ncbi:WW domain-containing adapter protein with coiled-coil-like isoform X1 [Salvia splendens]|uniref:WW domain-containing adapter protein with coiled-coil-like isoform X1 n=2 Tax=Salvia splendens TaxID=180675 RepID=UPI001C262EF6|nr:WW domain-containing adapter protein with coiled-coil-like isoform X1 [Salvia splendens]